MEIRRRVPRSVFLAAVVVAFGIVVLLWVQHRWHEVEVMGRRSDLKALGMAIHQYNDTYGHLPPVVTYDGDVAMHSWRMLVMEFLDPSLFAEYRMDEPWHSPHNSTLSSRMPNCFYNGDSSPDGRVQTSIVAPYGEQTVLRSNLQASLTAEELVEGPNRDSIMLVELPDMEVHWMSPHDPGPEEIIKQVVEAGSEPEAHFVTVHGRVRMLSELSIDQ